MWVGCAEGRQARTTGCGGGGGARTSMNLRSRCDPTGSFMSGGAEKRRTTTTKVMKSTEQMERSDVLVSAAMFFSIASGSTAPTAMATSTMRLTQGCATMSMPVTLAKTMDIVSPMPIR